MKPFIEQRADPYIIRKDGWYYFTASVPEFDRIILRKARNLKELPDAVEKVICHTKKFHNGWKIFVTG